MSLSLSGVRLYLLLVSFLSLEFVKEEVLRWFSFFSINAIIGSSVTLLENASEFWVDPLERIEGSRVGCVLHDHLSQQSSKIPQDLCFVINVVVSCALLVWLLLRSELLVIDVLEEEFDSYVCHIQILKSKWLREGVVALVGKV